MIKKIIFLLCCMTIGFASLAQNTNREAIELRDYITKLSTYRSAMSISSDINAAFKNSDIKKVRELKQQRVNLLEQTVDSLFAKYKNATNNIVIADFVSTLVNYCNAIDVDRMMSRFNNSLTSINIEKLKKELIAQQKVALGNNATDFKLYDANGKKYSLRSFKGKYVFLEFSASWCGWCKQETPHIKRAYDKFKNDVVFITVYLDDNRQKWLDDMNKHPIDWLGLSDLKAWYSPLVEAYSIMGVPDCYLISKDRKIVAKGMRGDEVYEAIKNELNKK